MSTSTVKVQFIQHRQPPLDSGTYTVEVEQKVKTKQSDKIPEQTFSKELTFYVDGHRFAPLTPDSIYAVFPPAGNLGEYSNALPHIILKRGTLPWERTIKSTNSDLPWLALLLFQESEKPEPQTIKLKELKATSGNTKFPTFAYEPGQNDEDVVTVIDVPKNILEKILPPEKDLTLLASVNQITNEKNESLSEPLATILGNRLPKKGEVSTVHLVALEERYNSGTFDYQGAGPNDFIRLVSLASWSFTCVNSKHNFDALLKEIDREPDTLRLPSQNNHPAKQYLDLGYVPLHHALRQGDKTVSWYHSPLSTGQSQDNLTAPVAIADQLMRYDPNTGMFDVSYAMAWQLGRMLTLQNQPLAVEIFNWKRSKAQDLHQIQQQVLHLPFQSTTETNGDLPTAIANWFQDLELLKNVPFNYLVPDTRLLPPESLRFFWIDSYWVDCLQDGAFSVGRVTKEDLRLDVQTRSLQRRSLAPSDKTITGFLLHSEVVSGWPGLEIEGYVNRVTGTDFVGPENKLTILRRDLLSDNILLCFFAGEVKTLDLSLQGSSVNCGVDPIKKGTKITKGLRNLDGEQKTGNIEVPFRNENLGVINIEEMTKRLKQGLNVPYDFTSAQLAATMIEGSPKVRFVARG
ncbi:hypothetical protein MYAER_2575 [Microcystis aeruginosa NIES-2549]|uniref:Uncharacterized protein n=3 Tax=Microcystis aeruginosa TaxID=1126 RepID=A0A0F6U595_MICAE|nr:hypothetical protein [Microcystis aeruginosa]AKE64917.1 hypothetical protein MYAER_2575 [Microcystis aeruginosa NIES-2549]GCL48042.1 hypothetical protein NIES3787_37560 [Microcystis aeruginosa NIES-3787]GCL60389.1 hypothetical protein NIES3807_35730 [Microcystis aeruginosa NIES-3807]